jgi:CxxC motif-containing protein (DUF1111 family)
MNDTPLARARRKVTRFCLAVIGLVVLWLLSPGLPILRAPSANAATKQAGHSLFVHEWTPQDPQASGDGLGPVFNANSCVACHFQSGVGGGGSEQHNVQSFVALPTKSRPTLQSGVIHAESVDPANRETLDVVHRLFPVVPGGQRVIDGCTVRIQDFDPVRTQQINTPALFGAGWIDRISTKSITNNWKHEMVSGMSKEFNLDFTAIPAGRPRKLADGRVGRFGWKAQFATLQEFVAAACANELGLGNPLMQQARPLGEADSSNRARDMSRKQFGQLVAFVDTLPRPVQTVPHGAKHQDAPRGQQSFQSIGCAHCHTPDLGGVRGIYSDLLLHRMEDPQRVAGYTIPDILEVPLPNDEPSFEEWKTPPLWGVADSAPYFHDGGSATLRDAILRHAGSATPVTEAFRKLSREEQDAIVAFLETLKAPPDAPEPILGPSAIEVAQK